MSNKDLKFAVANVVDVFNDLSHDIEDEEELVNAYQEIVMYLNQAQKEIDSEYQRKLNRLIKDRLETQKADEIGKDEFLDAVDKEYQESKDAKACN